MERYLEFYELILQERCQIIQHNFADHVTAISLFHKSIYMNDGKQ